MMRWLAVDQRNKLLSFRVVFCSVLFCTRIYSFPPITPAIVYTPTVHPPLHFFHVQDAIWKLFWQSGGSFQRTLGSYRLRSIVVVAKRKILSYTQTTRIGGLFLNFFDYNQIARVFLLVGEERKEKVSSLPVHRNVIVVRRRRRFRSQQPQTFGSWLMLDLIGKTFGTNGLSLMLFSLPTTTTTTRKCFFF